MLGLALKRAAIVIGLAAAVGLAVVLAFWGLRGPATVNDGREPPGLYGIPTIVDARMMYTNLDLLRQEGLVDGQGQPKLPANWDELRADSRRLSRYRVPGQVGSGLVRLGFGPAFGDSYLYMFAFQA